MIITLLATVVMLGLGLALLSVVDTQAQQSGVDRTRDRAFNLSESVLNSEAFVLGRNWRSASTATCGAINAGFSDTLGSASPSVDAKRIASHLNRSYTDAAYSGASWQVNICDDVDTDGPLTGDPGKTVWSSGLLASQQNADVNNNDRVWVRASSTVAGKSRSVVGLVQVRRPPAMVSKYGLVAGNVREDLGTAVSSITNATVLTSVMNGLLNTNSPVAEDPGFPAPASGVTGLRCGLLSQAGAGKTCVTGTIAALSALGPFDALVTGGRYSQYPSVSSTSADTIGQLRKQAKDDGQYIPTVNPSALNCGITLLPTSPTKVVFIEKVGNGDEACVLDVSTSKAYKAVIIGSGRIIIRGDNTIAPYNATGSNPKNLLTAVVYALNLQTTNQSVPTPTKELVRVEKGARVKGAVHADGANATVALIPDVDSNALVCALVSCPSLLATTLQALGVTDLVNTLISGGCLVRVVVCVLSLPPTPVGTVLGAITSQLSTYGSAIRSDVATIKALTVYGASGVLPESFRDLQAPG